MKNSFRGTVAYTAILLSVVGVAYYGGKANWFQPRIAAPVSPRSARPKVPPASAAKQADLQFKALLADILAGNWPDGYKTSKQKSIFFEMLIANGAINPRDFPDLVAWLHDQPDSRDRQMMMFTLLGYLAGRGDAKLSAANPRLALQMIGYLTDPTERQALMGDALNHMAGDDPQKALAELAKLPPGSIPLDSYTGIFGGIAAQDPAGAAAIAASLPPGSERDYALQGVTKVWLRADPAAAINWASSLPPENSAVFDGMIDDLANRDPMSAASYLDKITDPTAHNDAVLSIARVLAAGQLLTPGSTGDPAAALIWLNQNATGTTYATAVAKLFNGLTAPSMQTSTSPDGTMTQTSYSPYTQNTTLAISLLANITDPSVRSVAINSVASGWAISDPQAALTWVQTLPDSDATSRAAALNTIVTTWSKTDSAAAVAFVQNSSDPSAFLSIAPALTQTMATTNPQAALAFAQSLPEGTAQTQALSNALVGVAGSNFTAAWTDATNLPPGDSQNTIMTNLVGVEAAKDPTQAAGLIQQLPPGPTQLSATTRLASTWVKLDPQAFTIWLNGLSPGDVRDTAIVQLASSSQATKNPSDVLAWVNTVSNPQTKAALVQQLTQAQAAASK